MNMDCVRDVLVRRGCNDHWGEGGGGQPGIPSCWRHSSADLR